MTTSVYRYHVPDMTVKTRQRKVRIPNGRRSDVRREEFHRLVDLLNERADVINGILRDQQIQFHRIAQIQAELDLMKHQWTRLKRHI